MPTKEDYECIYKLGESMQNKVLNAHTMNGKITQNKVLNAYKMSSMRKHMKLSFKMHMQ